MEYKIDSTDELPKVACAILDALGQRSIVIFRGEMGAGKTTLIRAICDELGVADTVTSPTFAIVNEYHDRDSNSVYHFDFYRINRIEEAFDFGYEEYFFSGELCLVEWPEKVESLIPDEVMTVWIEVPEEDRRVIRFD
ncbi:MAG: tRNA (adenosine(37)-N6)-threonylcarbamoyltransferase complex ATPase subunit type 1 TsaE [Alistipes sp.]|nr:tRNA (adenosine(37)-N6)-threonylcarbamoyltransferase complex ATPase subunit type 1 TsaE [Alistipes sp.]